MNVRKPRVFSSVKDIPSAALELIEKRCELVHCREEHPTKEQVQKAVKGVDAIFWFWYPSTGLDKELLNAAGPNLKVISLMSSGFEHVDMKEVQARGIKIGYAPGISSSTVADMAVTLLLAVIHRIQEGRAMIDIGDWDSFSQRLLTYEVCESTVGIVGFGSIGQAIARRLKAFEPQRILYCGPNKKAEAEETGAEYVTFEELLSQSDFVLISCRLNDKTRHMFNDAAFAKMKQTSTLINIARGGIVDHDALIRALQNNTIWGAGLDVMVPEPLPGNSPLFGFYNCVLAPHVGSSTIKARNNLAMIAAHNLLSGLDGKPMPSPLC